MNRESTPLAKLKIRITISILFLIFLVSPIISQESMGFSVQGARGFLLPHRQNMLHLPDGPAHFAELRVFTQVDGSNAWHSLYDKPQIGTSLRFFNLANDDLLGYGIGMAAYFSSPVIHLGGFKWYLELGAGPGIVTKPFDPENNYQNIAIGSYGNVYVFLGQRMTFDLSPRLNLDLAASFNHFSNAAVTLPNLGVNYPMVSAGLTYHPKALDDEKEMEDLERVGSVWIVKGNIGVKQSPRPYNTKFPTYSLTGGRLFGMTKKSSITLGGDLFANMSLYHLRLASGESITPAQNLQAGVHLSYGMHIDEAIISLTMGAYLLDSYQRDGWMYHRAGIRYFFHQHWGANLSLKTHLFKADYFELGLVYRI